MNLLDPHYGRDAVLAALEGDYSKLAARLRRAAEVAATRDENILISHELNLAADIIDRPTGRKRGPLTGPLQAEDKPKKSIIVAGEVLRLSHGYTKGEVAAAVMEVAKKFGRSEASVKNHIRIAKRYLDGKWWEFKVRKFSPN